ncbi:hypothetical protein SporoP32a_11310 [Sporosarcina ureae]|nr:hypothetical protein SporoP32a_11310 [Sporosarcina ureae]
MKSNKQLVEIIYELNQLGGEASLGDINEVIRLRNKINLTIYADFNSIIRNTIYRHSSDTDIFVEILEYQNDFFYSIDDKGSGR